MAYIYSPPPPPPDLEMVTLWVSHMEYNAEGTRQPIPPTKKIPHA